MIRFSRSVLFCLGFGLLLIGGPSPVWAEDQDMATDAATPGVESDTGENQADLGADPAGAPESTETTTESAAEPAPAPVVSADIVTDDAFINFVKEQQDPAKASTDAVDPQGLALIDMDGERAYYSGRDLIALMKQAHDKTTNFAMAEFQVTGRIETDHTVTVNYAYDYQATTEGITVKARLTACETYEKLDGKWRLVSGAYWHKVQK